MKDRELQRVDYDTHILIGYATSGKMAVICHWSHLPRQEEVQWKIDAECQTFAAFLLCTPTSIMTVGDTEKTTSKAPQRRSFR